MEAWTGLKFFGSEHFDNIVSRMIDDENKRLTVLPGDDNIFNAFTHTPLHEVKVVILGQDPYPNSKHAMGLCFSVPPDVTPLPASLKNIYKELYTDIGEVPENGCLIPWAKQGVLLLNTSLTVLEGAPASHSNIGWIHLTNEVIQVINNELQNIVFILWGKHAKSKSVYISKKNHCVIEGSHPSPQSANRGGFFGTRPFSRTNDYLVEHGKEPIAWT